MAWLAAAAIVAGGLWLAGFAHPPMLGWAAYLVSSLILLAASGVPGWLLALLGLLATGAFALLAHPGLRRRGLAAPLLRFVQSAIPPMSRTEREAAEAGKVWLEGMFFRGRPDWQALFDVPAPSLSEEEKAFLDGPVEELCRMLDDWKISHELRDLPDEVWAFLKRHRFFAMIIPKQYGGLGFSPYAHARVIEKIASRSAAAAVTVMVPNSLGPAELLLAYGTEAQKNHYLPRLAAGEEIPCFALTNPFAGSDAGAIPDAGILTKRVIDGEERLGFVVNFEKRYITLAPKATLIGLAFHAYDPEGLLGKGEDLGITVALVPADSPGIEIGRRHDPLNIAFLNGPIRGRDVFVPIEAVVGGEEGVGHGWRMLIERLSVGRGISLPSLSVGACKLAAFASGAYGRLRRQFHLPIARFEGVQERLGRIAGETWRVQALRDLVVAGIAGEKKPAILTAIAKRYLTEAMRVVINDAMDIHGGRGICMGPSNYLGRVYQSLPIAITVEGANILTRSLMIFGQGALRCHPFLQKEIEAAAKGDLRAFDRALCGHIEYAAGNLARALLLAIAPFLADLPAAPLRPYAMQIARLSASFAATSELALMTLGGALKRKEMISGRFADAWAGLLFAAASIKRFAEEGSPPEMEPFARYGCEAGLFEAQQALLAIAREFPIRWIRPLLRLLAGVRLRPPSDALLRRLAEAISTTGPARKKLCAGIFVPEDPDDILGRLAEAMELALQTEELEKRLRKAGVRWHTGEDFQRWAQRLAEEGIVSEDEAALLAAARQAIAKAVAVDEFADRELSPRRRRRKAS